jgi:deazaflavin-dependent oxidoreductase (nitroreductase family)
MTGGTMGSDELRSALQDTDEVELTTTGRKSGRESSRPIWFVEEGGRLLLLPIKGTDTGWYLNVRETPSIRLAADGADYEATAETTEDAADVEHVVAAFTEKYGADRVRDYYPKKNAAVQVPLG